MRIWLVWPVGKKEDNKVNFWAQRRLSGLDSGNHTQSYDFQPDCSKQHQDIYRNIDIYNSNVSLPSENCIYQNINNYALILQSKKKKKHKHIRAYYASISQYLIP